ncbi:hypothetical protein [Campylobacter armoricus]|uniref:Uncharacterized protein n=1 Tax=Campylobacter armoricus TaxID=2505970 RepID=A0A7L5ILJ8_9BACT|nr:hypothetical protein [Campylobacter armoricus]QKF80077.1 hypothetical protein CARM_1176 [Campylobacter armoricus]
MKGIIYSNGGGYKSLFLALTLISSLYAQSKEITFPEFPTLPDCNNKENCKTYDGTNDLSQITIAEPTAGTASFNLKLDNSFGFDSTKTQSNNTIIIKSAKNLTGAIRAAVGKEAEVSNNKIYIDLSTSNDKTISFEKKVDNVNSYMLMDYGGIAAGSAYKNSAYNNQTFIKGATIENAGIYAGHVTLNKLFKTPVKGDDNTLFLEQTHVKNASLAAFYLSYEDNFGLKIDANNNKTYIKNSTIENGGIYTNNLILSNSNNKTILTANNNILFLDNVTTKGNSTNASNIGVVRFHNRSPKSIANNNDLVIQNSKIQANEIFVVTAPSNTFNIPIDITANQNHLKISKSNIKINNDKKGIRNQIGIFAVYKATNTDENSILLEDLNIDNTNESSNSNTFYISTALSVQNAKKIP